MENSLKKIRKVEEAYFGKEIDLLRNYLLNPKTYSHFQKGIFLFQKIYKICNFSKSKKVIFEKSMNQIKEGLGLLNLDSNSILQLKSSTDITTIWVNLSKNRERGKQWYKNAKEAEKYDLPLNAKEDQIIQAKENKLKRDLKNKLKEERKKELLANQRKEIIKNDLILEQNENSQRENALKLAQKEILLLQDRNEKLKTKNNLMKNNQKYLKDLYSKVLRKINFEAIRTVLRSKSILYSCIFNNGSYEIKIEINKSWEKKVNKDCLVNAFANVLKISGKDLRIYYSGVHDKFEYTIDDSIVEDLKSLKKWTLIENKHSKVELGNIYVLSNQSKPNIYKIGFSSKNPKYRAKDIRSSLEISSEFIVEKSWVTKNLFEVEQKIFPSLEKYREWNSEFFNCELKKIFSTIKRNIQL